LASSNQFRNCSKGFLETFGRKFRCHLIFVYIAQRDNVFRNLPTYFI
jgi:hypothetical protein